MAEVEFFSYETAAFVILGISVVVHVALVSVTIGTSLITAIYRYLAYKRNDLQLEAFARKAFRLLAVTELFSGVWGTIITVVLAGFFPTLFARFVGALLVPIVIALIGIMIRLSSIAIFWYTWGRINPSTHTYIGFIVAITGFMIPFGFRALFSEITVPTVLVDGGSPFGAYASTMFWNLYLHTALAVISVGAFMLVSVFAVDKDINGMKIAMPFAFYPLMLQFIAGPLYYAQIHFNAKHMFESMTGGPFTPVLVIKVLLAFSLLFAAVVVNRSLKAGQIHPYAKYLGFWAIATAIFGEILNSGSRYPYMVVEGSEGINLTQYFNYYISIAQVFPAVAVILLFLVTSIVIFTFAAYYAMIKRYVV